MDWKNFLKDLRPEIINRETSLLEKLSRFESAPDLFWYPGSGKDFVPLLLDVPHNPTGRRLYRTDSEPEEKPVLFWMNDHDRSLKDFPDYGLLGKSFSPPYEELWKTYDAEISLGSRKEIYRFNKDITITLFSAKVKNRNQGAHDRSESGDEYLICFSPCDSEQLFEEVFAPYRFHLAFVALIAQGGFSKQRSGFNQYIDLPNRVTDLKNYVGAVDFWCIDLYGQKREMPAAPSLQEYEYIGGPLPWGWPPSRLYGRAGIQYSRERRPHRVGNSWRNLGSRRRC